MGNTISQSLSKHFIRLRDATPDALPDASMHALKRLLLDYLGVAIGGSRTHSGTIAARFALMQEGRAEATVIGTSARVPMPLAAFVNAIASHSIELDDIDVLALFHFSPPVYSAALAAAQAQRASGQQLLAALAAGCEMMERLSRAAKDSLRRRAWHITPVCGGFGATVAAGLLLGLDEEQLASALGLAGAQASGLMEMYGPSMQKRFNPGPAARNGVTAALLARLGFTGATTIFEGERGFLRAFTDESDASQLTADIDRSYPLEIEFKPYSCARPIHNAIDCALEIRRRDTPELAKITSIEVARHPDWAIYHQNASPQTYHEAQVSLPYAVAISFIEGRALLDQFADAKLGEPVLRQLASRVTIVEDRSLPRGVSCRMTVAMEDGRRLRVQVDYPKGSIQNPMTDDELRAKFESLAIPVTGEARAAQIANRVATIETCRDVTELATLLEA